MTACPECGGRVNSDLDGYYCDDVLCGWEEEGFYQDYDEDDDYDDDRFYDDDRWGDD